MVIRCLVDSPVMVGNGDITFFPLLQLIIQGQQLSHVQRLRWAVQMEKLTQLNQKIQIFWGVGIYQYLTMSHNEV